MVCGLVLGEKKLKLDLTGFDKGYMPFAMMLLVLDYLLIVSDPVANFEILSQGKLFPRSHHFEPDNEVLGGEVLFAVDGEIWKQKRKQLNPWFSIHAQSRMFDVVKDCLDRATAILDKHAARGEQIDLRYLLSCFTCDVISIVVFGKSFDCIGNSNEGKLVNEFYRTASKEVPLYTMVPFYSYLSFLPRKRAFAALRSRCRALFAEAVKSAPSDSMAGVLRQENGVDAAVSELVGLVFAVSMIVVLFLVIVQLWWGKGHETTANTLCFALGLILPASESVTANVLRESRELPASLSEWSSEMLRSNCPFASVRTQHSHLLMFLSCLWQNRLC
jgi:cytochrome P450